MITRNTRLSNSIVEERGLFKQHEFVFLWLLTVLIAFIFFNFHACGTDYQWIILGVKLEKFMEIIPDFPWLPCIFILYWFLEVLVLPFSLFSLLASLPPSPQPFSFNNGLLNCNLFCIFAWFNKNVQLPLNDKQHRSNFLPILFLPLLDLPSAVKMIYFPLVQFYDLLKPTCTNT